MTLSDGILKAAFTDPTLTTQNKKAALLGRLFMALDREPVLRTKRPLKLHGEQGLENRSNPNPLWLLLPLYATSAHLRLVEHTVSKTSSLESSIS